MRENMVKVSLEEAASLVSVFGEFDRKTMALLILFGMQRSKYDALTKMSDLPKSFRLPRATLYRKVGALYESGFLQVAAVREFVKGNLREHVKEYSLSIKGILTVAVHVNYLKFQTPHVEKNETNSILERFEELIGSSMVLDFLRWHRDRAIDLTNAKIDLDYFTITSMNAMLPPTLDITKSQLKELLEKARKRVRMIL